MSFSAGFLQAVASHDSAVRVLIDIELTAPSSRVVRLSSTDWLYAGNGYAGALESCDPIEEPGQFLSPEYDQCSFSFSVLDVWTGGQPSSDTFAALLSAYRFKGAKITLRELRKAPDGTFYDATMFVGIIAGYNPERGRVSFVATQRRDWNKTLDPVRCDRWLFPRAPEKSIGLVVPTVIGKGRGLELRGDYGHALGQARNNFDHNGGAIPSARGVLVDMGRGSTSGATFEKGKVLIASHAVSSIGAGTNGTNFFGSNGERTFPSVINPAGGDIINTIAGAGFMVPNQAQTYWLPVAPTDVVPVLNMADNPRGVLDPANEASFARIDQAAGQYSLQLSLPDIRPEGTMIALWLIFGYKTNAAIGDVVFKFNNPALGASSFVAPLASTTTFGAHNLGAPGTGAVPANGWNLSGCNLTWGFQVPAAGVNTGVNMRCHGFGLVIQYQPILLRGKYGNKAVFIPRPASDDRRGHDAQYFGKGKWVLETPIADVSDEYFANVDGPLDDGSGTYTGAASALISRAPDIAHYLLRTYCGLSAGDIETGVGALGSFADARAKLRTWNQRDMEHFLSIDTEAQAKDLVEQLARDSVSVPHIGRSDGKFRWTPFTTNPAVTFPRMIEPEDVIDDGLVELRTLPDDSIISSVRIAYLFDVFRNEYASEVSCTPRSSRAGYAYLGLRDESIVVVANQSDRLDLKSTAATVAVSLTPGQYQPWDFAKHVTTQANAAAVQDYLCHYGPRIETNYNDKIDINDGAVKVATIAQADYATMEDLATAAAAALNAVSTNWTVTYNRATRKMTIDRTAGAKTLLGLAGANAAKSALGALGLTNANAAAPRTSDHEVEEQRFVLACCTDTGFVMLNETGANGANAATPRTGAHLLGMQADRDTFAASTTTSSYSGTTRKTTREYTLADAETVYGARRPYTNTARTIRDTDTAIEARNRLIDLGGVPRVGVYLRSFRLRDLERYHVVQFSQRFDQFVRYTEYGSDGSWAGKKFWVVGCRHHMGPSRFDTEATLVRA